MIIIIDKNKNIILKQTKSPTQQAENETLEALKSTENSYLCF